MLSNFVDRFSYLLKTKNLTFRELERAINISSSQLSKYASGNYEPSLKNSLKIATYFNCSLDFLFGLTYIPNKYKSFKKADANKFCERLENLIALRKTNINRISKNIYVNRNAIYKWKKDKIFPKIGIIANLSKELDTTIEYLIGRTDVID